MALSRLLATMPRSWSHFKAAWNQKTDSQKKLENLYKAIREEAMRNKLELDQLEQATALLSIKSGVKPKFNQTSKFNNQRQSRNNNSSNIVTRRANFGESSRTFNQNRQRPPGNCQQQQHQHQQFRRPPQQQIKKK